GDSQLPPGAFLANPVARQVEQERSKHAPPARRLREREPVTGSRQLAASCFGAPFRKRQWQHERLRSSSSEVSLARFVGRQEPDGLLQGTCAAIFELSRLFTQYGIGHQH